MTDTEVSKIEDDMLQLSKEFEKELQQHEPKEPEPEPKPESEPEPEDKSELVELQKKYDYIVKANLRNQRRIKHLLYLLDEMGRRAAKLGLRFDEMESLAD
jgi:hypothetical protein